MVLIEEKFNDDLNQTTNSISNNIPINNGNIFDTYFWTQNSTDISVTIPLQNIIQSSKDIEVIFHLTSITVRNKQLQTIILEGLLCSKINVDNCTWYFDKTITGERTLVIELEKLKKLEWWIKFLISEPELDSTKFITPDEDISMFDSETRMSIDKLIHENKFKF